MPASGRINKIRGAIPTQKHNSVAMKQFCALLLALFSAFGLSAQSDSIRAEIDQQVWRPFVQAYDSYDAAAYNRLHTPDVLRGGRRGLMVGEEYFDSNRRGFTADQASGAVRHLSLCFETRVQHTDVAYEIGYYQALQVLGGEQSYYYGQFHVVLKKQDGHWKIAQDWDSGEVAGRRVSEADYLKFASKGVIE